jgi:hypothetical protein
MLSEVWPALTILKTHADVRERELLPPVDGLVRISPGNTLKIGGLICE